MLRRTVRRRRVAAAARQLRARRRAGRRAGGAAARRRTRAAGAGDQPGPARARRRGGPPARAAGAGRLDGPVRRPGARSTGTSSSWTRTTPPSSRRSAAPWTGCRWPSSSPPPACGRCRSTRSPAGSTTGSRCCGTRPAGHPSAGAALAGAIGWSYDLLFPDDQRGLWALSVFAGGAPLAAAEHVLGALDVPAESAVDVVGRLVDRSLVTRRRRPRAGAVRYRLLDSIRAFAARPAGRGRAGGRRGAPRTPPGSPSVGDRCAADGPRPGQPGCLAFVRAERANIDAALAWSADQDPLLGLRIAIGFGWTWVVLGDGVAGAARVRDAVDRGRCRSPRPARRPRRCCSPAGSRPRPATWSRRSGTSTGSWCSRRSSATSGVRADATRHLAFLRIQQGRPQDVLAEAGASRRGLPASAGSPGRWPPASCSRRTARSCSATPPAPTAAAEEAVDLLTPIGDSWGMVHAAGHARRDRAGRAPVRRGRDPPGRRRGGVRAAGVPGPGRAAPDPPGPGRAAARQPGRRHRHPRPGDRGRPDGAATSGSRPPPA